MNQTGNSDGSSTLFALTPTSNSCPTICFTETAVPNATLVAFDFSPFVNEQLVFTGDNYFCLCLLVPADLGPPTRVGGSVMSVGGTAAAKPVPAPDLLPPWPEEAMSGSRESVKFEIAHFIPVGKTALGIDPETAIDEITHDLPRNMTINDRSLGLAATVQNFTDTLAKPLSAVGFIGHSVDDSNVVNNQIEIYSVGLLFADHGLVAPPNDDPQFPVRQYANAIVTPQIKTQAKVVFIGSCFIGPPFKALWNIQDNTVGQALVVPKGSSSVTLGHAVVAWAHLLDDLIRRHMSVGNAVKETNAYLLQLPPDAKGNRITEQWQVVGDGNVKLE